MTCLIRASCRTMLFSSTSSRSTSLTSSRRPSLLWCSKLKTRRSSFTLASKPHAKTSFKRFLMIEDELCRFCWISSLIHWSSLSLTVISRCTSRCWKSRSWRTMTRQGPKTVTLQWRDLTPSLSWPPISSCWQTSRCWSTLKSKLQ